MRGRGSIGSRDGRFSWSIARQAAAAAVPALAVEVEASEATETVAVEVVIVVITSGIKSSILQH